MVLWVGESDLGEGLEWGIWCWIGVYGVSRMWRWLDLRVLC